MITIRRATLEDKPAIFAFLEKAYGDKARYKYPERWEWQFEKNPYKPNDELPVFIAVTEDGQVVGQSAAMYEPLKIEQESQILAWALDAYVLEEYRGQNLGFETLRINCENHPLWMGMVMAPSSRHILLKLGCQPTDKVIAFRRMAHIDPDSLWIGLQNRTLDKHLLRKFGTFLVKNLRFSYLGAWFINTGVNIHDFLISSRIDNNIKIQECTTISDEFDKFWQKIQGKFSIIVERDSTFLTWKYHNQPNMNYKIFSAHKNGEMTGYIILRFAKPPESNTGIIADILADPDDRATLAALINTAVRQFKAENLKYISAASSIPAYQRAFRIAGFLKQKEIVPLLNNRCENPSYRCLFDSGHWFLGRSDHDWDQFPYA